MLAGKCEFTQLSKQSFSDGTTPLAIILMIGIAVTGGVGVALFVSMLCSLFILQSQEIGKVDSIDNALP